MRTIKFRGKASPRHEWVYGDYFNNHQHGANHDLIINYDWDAMEPVEYYISRGTLGQNTGFKDKKGVEIYEGDILSDWNEVDGKMIQSKMQVFWCEKVGAWKLDNSYKQDKSSGDLLSDELLNFTYKINGNIHEAEK